MAALAVAAEVVFIVVLLWLGRLAPHLSVVTVVVQAVVNL
jgi:hypothetical protein